MGDGGETQPFLGEGASGGKTEPCLLKGELEGAMPGWSAGLLLGELLRSTLNPSSIFIFLSRELNAVPLCPVDKEVIKSQEVRKSLLWFSSSLGDGDASVLSVLR